MLGFPAAARLLTAGDYKAVFAARRPIKTHFFSVHRLVLPAQHVKARLGLVIGKKQCPLASRRNLVKRLIREHFRQIRSELTSGDLVFRLATRLPQCATPELKQLLNKELGRLFRQLSSVAGKPS